MSILYVFPNCSAGGSLSKTHGALLAASFRESCHDSHEDDKQGKYVPIERTFFFPAQLTVIFSCSIVPQSSSQCGIPINFKRQISD